MNHVSVSPTNGNGPTKGQRKTLTRVGPGRPCQCFMFRARWDQVGPTNVSCLVNFLFNTEHVKQFEILTKGAASSFGQPYDFQSIMHYSNKAFSKNGRDTIQSIADPSMQLGNANSLSAVDVLQINLLYRCPEALKQGICTLLWRARMVCRESV